MQRTGSECLDGLQALTRTSSVSSLKSSDLSELQLPEELRDE